MAEKIVKDSQGLVKDLANDLVNDLVNDTISRQAVIDVINESNSPIAEYLIGEIMALSSAQPKCAKDFVMLKVIDLNGRPYYSIIYLENGNEFEGYSSYDLKVISEYLKRYFGFAQPERKRGRWNITDAYPHNVYCSECYTRFAQTHWAVWEDGSLPRNFCPHCGADMREDEQE